MASFRSSSHGEVRKINIVYFLSRGGQVEHPHLLKVYPVVQSRVRLRDIKRWLAKVRGKDMPDAFSWSYKRRYKTGYVWQDLCDDDLVTPMSDNEYILKGSEIFPSCKDKYKADGSEEQRNSLDLEEIQDENQVLNNGSKLLLELDLSTSQENYAALKESRSEDFSKSSVWNHHQQPPDKCYSFNEDYKLAVEYITKLNGGTPSITSNDSGEVIRVYKAVTSSASVPIMDAEAQTGESQRMISENEEAGKPDSSSEITQEINPVSSPKKQPPGNYEGQVFQEQLLSSPKITADNHEPRVAGELRGGSLRNKPEQSKESRDSRCEPVTPMSLEPSKSRMRENILSNGTALQVGRQNSKNDESSSEKLRSSDAVLAEKTVISEPKFQGKLHKSYSKLSCVRNDVAVAFTESSQASPKTKKPAASQVLKQLFTCGSTETKPSGARSLKSLTLPRTFSNDSRNSTPRASDLQATTPKAGTPTKREHAVKLEPKLNDKTGDDCSICVLATRDDEAQSLCKCRMPGRRSSSSAKITGNIVPGQA